MIKGTLTNGFEFEYDENRLDDMRFVDVLADVVDPEASLFTKTSGVSRLLNMLLGPELKTALYEHIGRSYDGRVPKADVETALTELMKAAGKDAEKNS